MHILCMRSPAHLGHCLFSTSVILLSQKATNITGNKVVSKPFLSFSLAFRGVNVYKGTVTTHSCSLL